MDKSMYMERLSFAEIMADKAYAERMKRAEEFVENCPLNKAYPAWGVRG